MRDLTEQATKQWLHLLGCGFDRHRLSEMMTGLSGPAELLDLSERELEERFRLTAQQRRTILSPPDERVLAKQLRASERLGIDLIPAGDPRYPENLFKMHRPPAAIFVRGRIENYDALAVGIVGPRNATPYGVGVARKLAQSFAPTLTVISGAAMGIDSVAHEAVLDAGGRTIAVLGCGIDVDYPATNAALRERIGSGEAGALLSIFPPGTQPHRHNFPARNYILAGLSLAVIVAEASSKSGALVTARAAADEGRAVYAVPGDIHRRNSEGGNQLLRDGAAVCTKAEDVIGDLEFTLRHELLSLREKRAPEAALPDEEKPTAAAGPADSCQRMLLDRIRHHPITHDDLIAQFVPGNMSIGDLSGALLMLELNGLVEQQPGRLYAPKL